MLSIEETLAIVCLYLEKEFAKSDVRPSAEALSAQ